MSAPLPKQSNYATAASVETVERIRALLSKKNIPTVETLPPSSGKHAIYRCDLSLKDTQICGTDFTVTGSGLSPFRAMETAYLKYIAHLSCGVLQREPFDCADIEDITYIPWQSFIRDCPPNVMFGLGMASQKELAEFFRDVYGETLCCVPYETEGGNPALLPRGLVRQLCGTTGLCAGNTREEALLHGLMDIYEQYVIRKLYQYCFTPPVIPAALFDGTGILDRIRKLGYPFSIFDCSLGKSFPAVGLALARPDGKRAFAPGAGASPAEALERCLTALLQGGSDALERRFHQPGALDALNHKQVFKAYNAALLSADGPWPDSLFESSPWYPFAGFNAPLFDDAAHALRFCLDTVSQYGGTLYFRNCSRLGYPVYELYMPGASETHLNFTMTRQDFLLKMQLLKYRGAE